MISPATDDTQELSFDGPAPDTQAPPTVLIVDDDSTARLALAAIIAPVQYRIAFASDAADARERLDLIKPDVIICDLVMAEMCGDEFFRWLQAHGVWRFVPVIGVTQLNSHVIRTDLLLAGADGVLTKPCNGPELRALVQVAMRTRHKYVELQTCCDEMARRGALLIA
jgi:CheY-like chemotaxis protein